MNHKPSAKFPELFAKHFAEVFLKICDEEAAKVECFITDKCKGELLQSARAMSGDLMAYLHAKRVPIGAKMFADGSFEEAMRTAFAHRMAHLFAGWAKEHKEARERLLGVIKMVVLQEAKKEFEAMGAGDVFALPYVAEHLLWPAPKMIAGMSNAAITEKLAMRPEELRELLRAAILPALKKEIRSMVAATRGWS